MPSALQEVVASLNYFSNHAEPRRIYVTEDFGQQLARELRVRRDPSCVFHILDAEVIEAPNPEHARIMDTLTWTLTNRVDPLDFGARYALRGRFESAVDVFYNFSITDIARRSGQADALLLLLEQAVRGVCDMVVRDGLLPTYAPTKPNRFNIGSLLGVREPTRAWFDESDSLDAMRYAYESSTVGASAAYTATRNMTATELRMQTERAVRHLTAAPPITWFDLSNAPIAPPDPARLRPEASAEPPRPLRRWPFAV